MVATDGETGREQAKQNVSVCNTLKKRNEHPNTGGVSIRTSWSGATSRKGCVVNGGMTKASKK